MFCPACGVDNNAEKVRFCRSCGADLRAVSQALSRSVPLKIASTLDAYLENRFQRNLGNGVLSLIAFVALEAVGTGHLIYGWPRAGVFMILLGLLSLILGLWDIWIYRRNLPPVPNQSTISTARNTNELEATRAELVSPPSVAESTTRKLEVNTK